LDFADVRTVMTEMGKAMMGTGEAQGEGRALLAAENAIQNPLLDEVTLRGAKAVLVNITGGLDMTLLEVDEAANAISAQVDAEANIIFGAAFDPSLKDTLRVSVVATGMDGASIAAIEPAAPRRTARQAEPETLAPEPVAYVEPEPAPLPEPVTSFEPEPVASEPEAVEPELAAYEAPPEAAPPIVQPKLFEPLRAAAYNTPPAIEPQAVAPAEPTVIAPQPRAVPKIVDPLVAEDEELPFLSSSRLAGESRPQKGGWLSLFGGRRQEPPRPALRSVGSAQPVEAAPEEAAEDADDLEIPSFLRRLAN
ncbi:MAG TPA: cell division protein FtsZ, partial [Caulobacteraceae bacterium]|nr:cell division protein FtsZ [Caulobacteraceae bacterium]